MALLRATIQSNRFGQVGPLVQRRLHDVAFVAATNIAERAAASMEGSKHGHIYGRHQASAPGEAPAIDTGILHGSMFTREVGPAAYIAGTNVEYAPDLEMGTVNIEARPFLLPAAEDERTDFERAVAAAVGGLR